MEDKTYVPLYGFVIPAYLYIEGEEKKNIGLILKI